MRPVPIVSMDEVLPYLSERGKMEWELAVTKAQLTRALADPSEVVASGHIPELSPVPSPTGNQLTTPE